MKLSLLGVLVIASTLPSCTASEADVANGDDPIEALAAGHPSDRYTSGYWTRTMGEDPALWQQAVTFCAQNNDADHPNCAAVEYARALEVQSRPPEYEANTSLRPGAQTQPSNDPR